MNEPYTLHVGDCRTVLRGLDTDSADAVVTDPPYGLSFMGKQWDYDVPDAETWREVLRVLKPGGHLLAFFGARTYHRGVVQIEDAGFEIRDQIMWVYGSGMPKGKAVLKPSHEPVVMARKPLIGTLQATIGKYGTGGLNIEECRIGDSKNVPASVSRKAPANCYGKFAEYGETPGVGGHDPNLGRWPANLIHDGSDEVLACFPDSPVQIAPRSASTEPRENQNVYGAMTRGSHEASRETRYTERGGTNFAVKPGARRLDTGSAARFFYCAKASRKDRGEGNDHPTVKPTELMRYLCRLVTPSSGVVLDPFAGSGSTGKAALLEGFRFVGIEQHAPYVDIARRRLAEVA